MSKNTFSSFNGEVIGSNSVISKVLSLKWQWLCYYLFKISMKLWSFKAYLKKRKKDLHHEKKKKNQQGHWNRSEHIVWHELLPTAQHNTWCLWNTTTSSSTYSQLSITHGPGVTTAVRYRGKKTNICVNLKVRSLLLTCSLKWFQVLYTKTLQ